MNYLKSRRIFTKTVWNRGDGYFRQGRVTITSSSELEATASVRGTSIYKVHLVFSKDGSLSRASCTCPVDGYCKHIVATMMQLDEDQAKKKEASSDLSFGEYHDVLERRGYYSQDDFPLQCFERNAKNFSPSDLPAALASALVRVEGGSSRALKVAEKYHFSDEQLLELFSLVSSTWGCNGNDAYRVWAKDEKIRSLILKAWRSDKREYKRLSAVISSLPGLFVPFLTDQEVMLIYKRDQYDYSSSYYYSRGAYCDFSPEAEEALIEAKRVGLLKKLLLDQTFRFHDEEAIVSALGKIAIESHDKNGLWEIIVKSHPPFSLIKTYWEMLSDAEKAKEVDKVGKECYSLYYENEFAILAGTTDKVTALRRIGGNGWLVLKEEILSVYPNRYQPALEKLVSNCLGYSKKRDVRLGFSLIVAYGKLDPALFHLDEFRNFFGNGPSQDEAETAFSKLSEGGMLEEAGFLPYQG